MPVELLASDFRQQLLCGDKWPLNMVKSMRNSLLNLHPCMSMCVRTASQLTTSTACSGSKNHTYSLECGICLQLVWNNSILLGQECRHVFAQRCLQPKAHKVHDSVLQKFMKCMIQRFIRPTVQKCMMPRKYSNLSELPLSGEIGLPRCNAAAKLFLLVYQLLLAENRQHLDS